MQLNHEEKVCMLKRSLYEFKQTSRQLNHRFDMFMIQSGFKRSEYDNCVYLEESENDRFIYLSLHVDCIKIY